MHRGFTLVETLLVITVVAVLAVGVITLLDPNVLIGRGYDTARKYDLSVLKKKFEEFNNDTGCYPRLDQVCYQGGKNGTLNLVNTNITSCVICGKVSGSPTFSPYLNNRPGRW